MRDGGFLVPVRSDGPAGSSRGRELFARGRRSIPNGSSATGRIVGSDGLPRFLSSGRGARVRDEDGVEYLDFHLAHGSLLHGHAPPRLTEAVARALADGWHLGAPTELEIEVAEAFLRLVPTSERIAFVTTGSEATALAQRIARAATGRRRILSFEGHYHDQADFGRLFVRGRPIGRTGAGDPDHLARQPEERSLVVPFNSLFSLEQAIRQYGPEIAAIVLEPIAGNLGVIPPNEGYLAGLIELARAHGVLVIFDESLTGFRVAAGGAQALYGVRPDLSCWSKALGAGMPLAAVSGREDLLARISSETIPIAGTYAAHRLALAGARANLAWISETGEELYPRLARSTERLARGMEGAAREVRRDLLVQSAPGMFQFYATARRRITNYRETLDADPTAYAQVADGLLRRGIYAPSDNYERFVLSSAHTARDLDRFLEAFAAALAERPGVPAPA